jgi:hypothetical protein
MPRDGWAGPEAEPGPSGSGGGAGSSGVRFYTMNAQDAVDRGVNYTPLAITQLQHEPKHMPRMKFEELCRNHEVYTLANAQYIVRLWNADQKVPPFKFCKKYGADICGYTAWLLEEDVGPETFWLLLRQQAAPPVQPDKSLVALWNVAKARRTEVLKARVIEHFSHGETPYPPEPAPQAHH